MWQLNQVVGEAFVKEIQKCLNELSGKLYKNHPERLARYLSVDANGEVNITVITSRLPLLLSGKANVTKADMLFMLCAGEGFFAGILHSAYSGTFIFDQFVYEWT